MSQVDYCDKMEMIFQTVLMRGRKFHPLRPWDVRHHRHPRTGHVASFVRKKGVCLQIRAWLTAGQKGGDYWNHFVYLYKEWHSCDKAYLLTNVLKSITVFRVCLFIPFVTHIITYITLCDFLLHLSSRFDEKKLIIPILRIIILWGYLKRESPDCIIYIYQNLLQKLKVTVGKCIQM